MRFQKSRDSQAKGWQVDFDARRLVSVVWFTANGTPLYKRHRRHKRHNGTDDRSKHTQTNGTTAGAVFAPAGVDSAGAADEHGHGRLDVVGHYFGEDGRLWEGDEEPLQGTLLFLRKKLEVTCLSSTTSNLPESRVQCQASSPGHAARAESLEIVLENWACPKFWKERGQ